MPVVRPALAPVSPRYKPLGAYQGPCNSDMGGAIRAAIDSLRARSQLGS